MRHPTASTITLATVAAVIAWIVPISPVAAVPAPDQVQVVNTAAQPAPVTGSVTIVGTPTVNVATLPAVTGTVAVSSLPSVSLADNTVGIDPAANTVRTADVLTEVVANGVFQRPTEADPSTVFAVSGADVSAARQVRLSLTCTALDEPLCAGVQVLVFGDSGGPLYDLDRFALGSTHGASRLYELPGTGMWVTIANLRTNMSVSMSLIGRAN